VTRVPRHSRLDSVTQLTPAAFVDREHSRLTGAPGSIFFTIESTSRESLVAMELKIEAYGTPAMQA